MSLKNFIVACVVIVAGLGLYTLSFPTYDVRYRLTLFLEVDGKPIESSGVVETSYQVGSDIFVNLGSGATLGGQFRGNAITINLGPKGLVFVVNYPASKKNSVLLTNLPFVLYGLPLSSPPSRRGDVIQKLLTHSGPIEIPLDKLPMFVRFRDIQDRRSNEEVNAEDLGSTYGSGVKLLRATLELTKDRREPIPANWPSWLADTSDPVIRSLDTNKGRIISLGTFPFKGE